MFGVILEKSDTNTSSALLNVAKKNMKRHPIRLRRNSRNRFTEYADNVIKRALKQKVQESKNATLDASGSRAYSYYSRSIFDKEPDSHIRRVFQTFLKGAGKATATCRQFAELIHLVREAYNDRQTILSLLSCVEKQKPFWTNASPYLMKE